MAIAEFHVSAEGQLSLPADVLQRWNLCYGGSVELADIGESLIVVPTRRGGMRAMLSAAVSEAGGYTELVRGVADDDTELA